MKYKVKNEEELPILELVCKNRGIDYKELESFLNPTEESIQNPFLYKNMDLVLNRIQYAVDNNEIIGIDIDSDVDGYCSAAMLANFLVEYFGHSNIKLYIHEKKEHGLTKDIINKAFYDKVNLLIVPDGGSSDYKQHKLLKDNGIDVLVIDHHECDGYSENAIVLNNQLNEDGNKSLCGAGMVLKVIEAFDIVKKTNSSAYYRDLASTALVSDCMDMRHPETRFYVQYGLRHLNNNLLIELRKAESDRDFTSISFEIAPTINAFIRVGSEDEKIDLFYALVNCRDKREISIRGQGKFELDLPEYIGKLSSRIKSRQTTQINKALEDPKTIINSEYAITVCIIGEETDKNLSGLLAIRLVKKFNKPAIVLKQNGEFLNGSGRTTDTFVNFKDFLKSLGVFEYCEGHQQAFGVGIKISNMKRLEQILSKLELAEDADCYLVEKAYIDNISPYDIMEIDKLSNQWSKGFEEPEFYIKLSNIKRNEVDIIGQKKDTIRIKRDHITFIKFKCTPEEINGINENNINNLEMIGKFYVNEWNDRLFPQVIISELKCDFGDKISAFGAFDYKFSNISW